MEFDSLFTGVGGMDLGFEWAGWRSRRMCEIDSGARKVLAVRWPGHEIHGDVRTFKGYKVDALIGGFPCQNLSSANVKTRTGLLGPKSGLWYEYLRIVKESEPRWVIAENSGAAWRDWVPSVRGDLYRIGYSSVCFLLYASSFGAPFQGARAFVVATPHGNRQSAGAIHEKASQLRRIAAPSRQDWGAPSARALGVDDGPARGVDRLRMAGNAVVPAMAEFLGNAINNIDLGSVPA